METKNIEGYNFEFLFDLDCQRDVNGNVCEYSPQENYINKNNLPFNKYGNGTFCRFIIPNKLYGVGSGVYAYFIKDKLVYIGECEDFYRRFAQGYGSISPRNCFKGGQATNCKINKIVKNALLKNEQVKIYFHKTQNYKFVESDILNKYMPIYNGRH